MSDIASIMCIKESQVIAVFAGLRVFYKAKDNAELVCNILISTMSGEKEKNVETI